MNDKENLETSASKSFSNRFKKGPGLLSERSDSDTFPIKDFADCRPGGSVQPQCIRQAVERLLTIGSLVFQGMAHTLLQSGESSASYLEGKVPMTNETDIRAWLKSTQREVRSLGHRKAALVHRRFAVSQERLWVACTDRDQLHRWFADVTGDLREGATLTFDVGAPSKVTSRILRCEPPYNLLLTWSYPSREIDEVALRLTGDGDGTVVELEHRSADKTEWWIGAGSGWEYALIKLSVLLRGDDPSEVSVEELDEKLGPLWTEAART